MKKIGLLSDTHGFLDEKTLNHLRDCDEIWHAGDLGPGLIMEKLKKLCPLRIVWGNIDDSILRKEIPEIEFFNCEGFEVLMIHIAGKFESYTPQVRELITKHKPKILVCGHSHILKIANDKKYNLLYLNPGAAGIYGFHKVRTLVRFDVENNNISNMRIVEMTKSGNTLNV